MLTDSELSAMRSVASDALGGTAVIQNYTETSDGGGGVTQAWTSSGTVSARLVPLASGREGEQMMGGRISADADFLIRLPYNGTVTTDSRIIMAGGTFNVEAIRERTWNLVTPVEVTKQT